MILAEQVRSTGNAVVDRVRERLSYNDIQVTRNPSVWKDAKTKDTAMYNKFNNELFHILSSEVFDQVCFVDCHFLQPLAQNLKSSF